MLILLRTEAGRPRPECLAGSCRWRLLGSIPPYLPTEPRSAGAQHAELADLDAAHERFHPKVTVLIENVRHHVKEEEHDLFSLVRTGLGCAALADLGDALVAAKASAPTHPHPRASDVPPANALAGATAGVVDRVGDNLNGLAQGGVSAVQELAARLTASTKPASSPTGSSVARRRANEVRHGTAVVAERAERTARAAKKGAASTARAATSGARSTVRAAKTSARTTPPA